MKEMLKARVMHKKSIQSVMNELKLLRLREFVLGYGLTPWR